MPLGFVIFKLSPTVKGCKIKFPNTKGPGPIYTPAGDPVVDKSIVSPVAEILFDTVTSPQP